MPIHTTCLMAAALLAGGTAAAQQAERGARLYLGLPGGEASCVDCHGPDPGLDRNRLLNAAQGPSALTLAISRAAAMGYLDGLLDTRDRADVTAWIAQVGATRDEGSVSVWPWGLEFGRVGLGADVPRQAARLRNGGTAALPVAPQLVTTEPTGAGARLLHDCPPSLAPGEVCTAWVDWPAPRAPGRLQAALRWDAGAASALPAVGIAAQAVTGVPAGVARWDDGDPALTATASPGAPAVLDAVLRNVGNAPLTLGVPALTGPGRLSFVLTGGNCVPGLVLAPAAACSVRVAATAPSAGPSEALLQWRNDGQHATPRVLRVTAVGLPAPSPAPPPAPPSPPPAPAPLPAPVMPPATDATPAAEGGGGCSLALGPRQADGLWPLMLVLAALGVARGGRPRPAPSSAAHPVSRRVRSAPGH